MEDAAVAECRTVRQPRCGNEASLVERFGSAPGHYFSGASGSGERDALLASDGASGASRERGPVRGYLCRYQFVIRGIPALESPGAARSGAGRIEASVVDSARGAAGRVGVLHQERVTK